MKKVILILVLVLTLSLALVACDDNTPETPETPDNNAPCTHADANYDAKCDSCGADVDVVRTIADAEAWNNAVMFNTTNNYSVKWATVYPEGDEATFDGYDYIFQFDGVTRKVEVLYFIFDENGKKEYVHEYEGVDLTNSVIVTKVENKYYEYQEYNGESKWAETDQEYYDSFMSECSVTSYAYGMFDQFTFNETTGQYEFTEDGVSIKVAFINGVITECILCFDDLQPWVAEIKYGSVQTITYPEIVIE